MTDEAAVQPTTPAADAVPPPATDTKPAQDGDATGKQAETAGKTFTQAEVDALITQRLERAKKSAEEAASKARTDAERKAAEQQGEYQKLYETTKAELEAAAQKAQALELAAMRRDVAERLGVPSALASRLQGATLEELEADAKTLIAALPKPGAPDINSGGGAKPPANGYSAGDVEQLAALYNVPSKYWGKN